MSRRRRQDGPDLFGGDGRSRRPGDRPRWEWRTDKPGRTVLHIEDGDRRDILAEAARIVTSYDTGVTLRQVFYRLVAALLLPNAVPAYKWLSRWSAQLRRDEDFPDLEDRTRRIHAYASWSSPRAALREAADTYRRDRTEGQRWAVFIGVEKATMVNQLMAWFTDPYGIPVLALGGYSSQTYCDQVARRVARDGRTAVLLYAGDFDPSGEDIDRDFIDRTGCFDDVVRVALLPEHQATYDLPEAMGKDRDSRSASFIARNGRLVQIELEALDPNDLRDLYTDALDGYWDTSTHEAALARENADRDRLRQLYEAEPDDGGGDGEPFVGD